jgi:membrane protein implicated in regulation of membrane protease activity
VSVLLVVAILLAVFVVGPPWNVLLVVGAVAVEAAEVWLFLRYSKRGRIQAGAETLLGATADVVEPLRPEGSVRAQGELWSARCAEGALPGEQVRVVGRDGLVLEVERL